MAGVECYNNIEIAVCGSSGADRSHICNGVVGDELLHDNVEALQTKTITDEVNQISIQVTSIATFNETNYEIEKYREEVAKVRSVEFDLILYCLPVKTFRADIEEDKRALDELKLILNQKSWNYCVVVLTFADGIVQSEKTKQNSKLVTSSVKKEYKKNILNWTEQIKRVFGEDVCVVPAGSSQCFSILEDNDSWLSNLFEVILRSTEEKTRTVLRKKNCHRFWCGKVNEKDLSVQKIHEHPILTGVNSSSKMKETATEAAACLGAGGAAGVTGATVGATIGALAIGIPSFGVAAGTGLVLGAAIGGGIGIGTGVGVTRAINQKKRKSLEEKEHGLI